MDNMKRMLNRFPWLAVLTGPDHLFLPLLEAGGADCITATSNFVARDLAFLYRHYADRERAEEVADAQARVIAARKATTTPFGQIASVKAVLAHLAGAPSWASARPPLTRLSRTQSLLVTAALDSDSLI